MTRFGHDPTQNLGHDRDPVMTHNTTHNYTYIIAITHNHAKIKTYA
jgi:hypothetical protein